MKFENGSFRMAALVLGLGLYSSGQAQEPSNEELARRIEALAAELENLEMASTGVKADESVFGLGPAASKVYRVDHGVSIGGYGEFLYTRYADEKENGDEAGKTDIFDMYRAIIYLGYKFSDEWVLNSEIEFEHANEAAVEFLTIDYLRSPELNFRSGLLLLPVGLVNELHEPTVFIGAKRSDTEGKIIPSTWREMGAGIFGDVGDFSYRSYLVTATDGMGFGSGGLRGGRMKGSKALAEDFALTARVDYTGRVGLLAGGSIYTGQVDHGQLGDESASVFLSEAHVDWRQGPLRLRGLYAAAQVDGADLLNAENGLEGSSSIGESMSGMYVEASYDVGGLSPYLRWETCDTQETVPDGYDSSDGTATTSLTLGVAWQPVDEVIFKVDYKDASNGAETGVDEIHASAGYIF